MAGTPGVEPGGPLVAAALQHVLHLQPQAGGQPPQVDVLLAGTGFSQEAVNSSDIGAAAALPAGHRGRGRTPTCRWAHRSQ